MPPELHQNPRGSIPGGQGGVPEGQGAESESAEALFTSCMQEKDSNTIYIYRYVIIILDERFNLLV